MIQDLFTQLGAGGTSFIEFLKNLIESVMTIFYTPAVGEVAGGFTTVGILMLVGMSVGIVYGVIRLITRFIHLRG